MRAKTTLLFLFLLSLFNLKSQTVIPTGEVYGDWFLSDSPFIIEGDIHVPADERLRIWPGVQVVFNGQYGFEIEGKLDATGTYSDSISFTYSDTSGFVEDTYVGWNGISFVGYNYSFVDSSKMAYCSIEFSGANGISCINYPYLFLRNSDLRFNKSSGFVLFDFSDIKAESIVIRENGEGGLVSVSSTPQISNFIIRNNMGSGISVSGNSFGSLTTSFSNGKILNNISQFNGGGVLIDIDAHANIENVEITNNEAVNGGGIYCGMGYLELNKVSLIGNTAENGGGIYGSYFSHIEMDYSLIVKNNANFTGGAASINQGIFNLNNCTLCVNYAGDIGGGILYDCDFSSQSTIHNTIIWDNVPGEIEVLGNGPMVSYSDIKGGYSGIENIDSDPLFIDPLNNNFQLSWTNYPEDNDSKSPCIDSGDPSSSQDPDGTFSDRGALYFDQGIYTSLARENYSNDVNVYPNPAQNFITISSTGNVDKIIIYSISGEVRLIQSVEDNISRLDISELISGVYFVKIYQDPENIATKKIIKK